MNHLEIIEKIKSFGNDSAKLIDFLQNKENLKDFTSAMLVLKNEAENLINFADSRKREFTSEELAEFNKLQGLGFEKILEVLKKQTS